MQIGELSSERSALKWQRGCDGRCHRDSPVTEKLIENMWSIYRTHIVIRVRGHFDVTNEVVPRKLYKLSSLCKDT